MNVNLKVNDFHYILPENQIAQTPAESRHESRLMHLNVSDGIVTHRQFSTILDLLQDDDVLIMNDARVIPARFYATRQTGGRVEVFILDGWNQTNRRRVLMKPARRIRDKEVLTLEDGGSLFVNQRVGKEFEVELTYSGGSWFEYLSRFGRMPLPPYIKREEDDCRREMDQERYQTIYAKHLGAVAAPTAGLHFSQQLLESIQSRGIRIGYVTLWVGWGTFKPVTVERICDHQMDTEIYSIPSQTAHLIQSAKKNGHRIVAVGTTSTRALESWALDSDNLDPVKCAEASLFITPGFKFRVVDSLITNFHLPGSTLLMLVSALAGREFTLKAYGTAVELGYRFYSYGDAMFISKGKKRNLRESV